MATLNWIGKEAVTNHDKAVPFKLLKKIKGASVGEASQNLIVHGDNLEALKALMPHYVGKVKCIYIDPPYNTGNEGWVYNDKVNSPKIRQWLGKVVGRESEDLTRHDKWLCMMYPRLKLLRDLLSTDGVIFISIDDNEGQYLKIILDEIFGRENFAGIFVWQSKKGGGSDNNTLVTDHEYVISYAKLLSEDVFSKIEVASEELDLKDEKGTYRRGRELNKWGSNSSRQDRPTMFFSILGPGGIDVYPIRNDGAEGCWRWGRVKMLDIIAKGDAEFVQRKNGSFIVHEKIRTTDPRFKPHRTWLSGIGATSDGSKVLKELFNGEKVFAYPKPVELIKKLIEIGTSSDEDIILDSFAGSGTTGHAVLDLNMDGGARRFIMVEMEDKVAKDITAERVKRAIKKYDYKDGFEYCELDRPLFNEHGQIEDSCDFKQFATYIYFTETQTNIDPNKISGNFIGEHGDSEYYLLYKGNLKNDLDKSAINIISNTDKKKVVYADRCLLDESELARYNIIFKQIPYEVKVY